MTDSLPQHIDSTMLSCFRSCPRKFYWEFVLGLRPKMRSADLHAGACFAAGLEHFYRAIATGLSPEESLRHAYTKFTADWGDYEAPSTNPKSQDNMWFALCEYVKTYPPHIDRFQPLRNPDGTPTVEFTFAIPLDFPGWPLHPSGEPFIYSGRCDGLGTYDKLTAWKDEKTSKGIGPRWADQWNLRGQFIGYTWAAQMNGFACDRGLIRGIGILKTEIKQIEVLKVYSQTVIDRWFHQLREDLERLRRAWDRGHFDYNFAESCSAYGGCPYSILCESPRPDDWMSTFDVRHWNPLQKDPVNEITIGTPA